MAYTTQPTMSPVINAPEETRVAFLVKVYQHVGLAIAAFIAFEAVLFQAGVAKLMYNFVAGNRMGWFAILGGFMLVQWFAGKSVAKLDNPAAQYGGLFGIAFAQSLIFAPFLYFAFNDPANGGGTVASAAAVTAMGFGALTLVAFVTRKDLSFLRPLIMWGFGAAMVLIVASLLFGFQLGIIFSVAMIALSGASILYQTQTIIRKYPEWAYVGAAVALFSSLMTMFWYVLRLFMQLNRR